VIELLIITCAILATGVGVSILMLQVQKRAQDPLLKVINRQQRLLASRDLQVYQGVTYADWETSEPPSVHRRVTKTEEAQTPEEQVQDAERMMREWQRLEGEMTHTAET